MHVKRKISLPLVCSVTTTTTKMRSVKCTEFIHFLLSSQVTSGGPPVLITGVPAHPLRQHPGPGPQAAAVLSELRGDNAQRGRGREDRDPGVSAPVQRPTLELHHHRQSGHIWTGARQRYHSPRPLVSSRRVDAAVINMCIKNIARLRAAQIYYIGLSVTSGFCIM